MLSDPQDLPFLYCCFQLLECVLQILMFCVLNSEAIFFGLIVILLPVMIVYFLVSGLCSTQSNARTDVNVHLLLKPPWHRRVRRRRRRCHYWVYRLRMNRNALFRRQADEKPSQQHSLPTFDSSFDESDSFDSFLWSFPEDSDSQDCFRPHDFHDSFIMFNLRYGLDFDAFCSSLDPLLQHRKLDEAYRLFATLEPPLYDSLSLQVQADAYIMATHLDTQQFERYHYQFGDRSPRVPMAYHSEDRSGMPIVLDTGCSHSLSPVSSDFIGPIKPCKQRNLRGLNGTVDIVGVGTVEWIIRDYFDNVRIIRTTAYYVPDGNIRLFSPQSYFQEQHGRGCCSVHADRIILELLNGSELTFPYHSTSNLPLMLLDAHAPQPPTAGFTFQQISSFDNPRFFLSVAHETNQNLTSTQRELLLWHWRFGHADMRRVQRLFSKRKGSLGSELPPLLASTTPTLSSCPLPLCAACQLSKQRRTSPGTKPFSSGSKSPDKVLSTGHLQPGDAVSVDQYQSSTPGRLPTTFGKELPRDQFQGGTIFVDHASSYVFIRHQVSLRAGSTVKSKIAFEQVANSSGVKVKHYHADNAPFNAQEFKEHLTTMNQTVDYSGVGAHHQNGVAERSQQTITQWARAMMLNSILHWPDQADLKLWPFALQHAVWIWNHLPRDGHSLSPEEIFSQTIDPTNHEILQRLRVWGCPVYVLDPKLQDGKKIPKWNPRTRRGQYLGFSPNHSTHCSLVLNLSTGRVSPQFHVVYDERFSTVPNTDHGGPANPDHFNEVEWARLIETGHEHLYNDAESQQEINELPPLHPEWLEPHEVVEREQQRIEREQRQRLLNRQSIEPIRLQPPSEQTTIQVQNPPVNPEPTIPDHDIEIPVPDPEPEQPTVQDIPEAPPEPHLQREPSITPQRTTRSGRRVKPNPRVMGEDWVNYSKRINEQKHRFGAFTSQALASMKWENALNLLRSNDLKSMMALIQSNTDVDLNTIEDFPPHALGAQISSEDTPNWTEAMSGPLRDGFLKACATELATLVKKGCYDIVERQPWMHVLPSIWAFRIKRFTDGTLRKLKAQFCVRGDKQIEGVDFFDTYAPVINWTTVRLVLILSIILNLQTVQVDYTCAFVHADIDKPPGFEQMSPTDQAKAGVYISMPRGFSEPGKVLRLNKSLYGL